MPQTWEWSGTYAHRTTNATINYTVTVTEAAYDTANRTVTLHVVQTQTPRTIDGCRTQLTLHVLKVANSTQNGYTLYEDTDAAGTTIIDQYITVPLFSDSASMTLAMSGNIGEVLDSYLLMVQLAEIRKEVTAMPVTLTDPVLSASSVNFGSSVTITTYDEDGAGLKYDISYSFGTASGSIGTNLPAGAKSWTLANSLMSQIPSATQGNILISVRVKNSSDVQIGSWELNLTGKVPASVKPTISSVSIAEAASIPSGISGYVKGRSKLSVSITAAAGTGTTVKSYRTVIEETAYDGASFTSNALATSGTVGVKVTVTDGRGRTATSTTNITVQDYSLPKITGAQAYRCTSSSSTAAKPDGAYICVKPLGSITALSGNAKTCKVYYKKSTASTYSNVAITMSDYVLDTEYKIFAADVGSSYDVYVTLQDSFGTTKYVCPQVSSAGAFIHIPQSRDGIGLGKRVENANALETAWDVKSNGDVVADADGVPVSLLDASKRVRNYFDTRPSTMDIPHENNGGIVNFKATSAATASGTKPPGSYDAHILHFFWDNASAYDVQLAVKNRDGAVYKRGQNNGTWTEWIELLDSNNYKSFFTSAVMEELLEAMELSSANVTLVSGKAVLDTNGNCTVRKTGKMVELNGYNVKASSAMVAGDAFATIPEGYMPASAFIIEVVEPLTSSTRKILVGGNGSISAATSFTSGSVFHFRAFYYTI